MGRRVSWTRAGWAASATLLAAGSTTIPAHAEQSEPEHIVVTTTRVSTDWLDRADSAYHFDSEEIQRVDADHFSELLNRAPGVEVNRGNGVEHLTAIRSPILTAGAGAGSFLYLEDGVPLRSAGFGNINGLYESMSELAGSVEVVRGPGSVLYGSNAVHGLINVLTPAPTTDYTTLELSASTVDRKKATIDLSRKTDGGGVYAGVYFLDEGGWRDAASVGMQKGLLRWDASGGPWQAQTTLALVNLNQETAGYVTGLNNYQSEILSRMNANPDAYRDGRAARLQSRITYTASPTLSLAWTPYTRWNDLNFEQHFLPGTPIEHSGHWSVGSLFTAYWQPLSRVSVVSGFDLEYTDGYVNEFQRKATVGNPPSPTGLHYDFVVDADMAAIYSDVNVRLTDKWSLQAGARGEWTQYDYNNHATVGVRNAANNGWLNGRFFVPDDRTDDYTTFTPKAALLRKIGDNSAAYIRYAEGARAPQTNDAYRLQSHQVAGQIKPESIESVEVGYRGSNDFLTWDVAAYWMEKKNFFFRDAAGLNVSNGKTEHKGVEASLIKPFLRYFEASVSASYADHTWEFNHPADGIVSGSVINAAPHWLANGRLRWFPTNKIDVEAEWQHMDTYFIDEADTPALAYPGHDVWDLRASWQAGPKTQLFMIVRDLTNTNYAERADFATTPPPGQPRYFPAEPRNFTFGIRQAL
jgi:outer membrane receptor protein involved in Fe transport